MSINRVREALAKQGIDAVVASFGENIYYCSGLKTIPSVANRGLFNQSRISEAVFVVVPQSGEATLICSAGVAGVAEEQSHIKDIRFSGTGIYREYPAGGRPSIYASKAADVLVGVLKEKGLSEGRVGIEFSSISYSLGTRLTKEFPKVQFVDAKPVFTEARMIKTPWEIANIRNSVKAAEIALSAAIDVIGEGTKESDILQAYKRSLINQGLDWGTTSVGAGANSAETYNLGGSYAVKKGDVVRFDLGAITNGYFSDISRTVVLGRPSDTARRVYDAIYEAEQTMLSMVKPGALTGDIYEAGVSIVRKHGFLDYVRGNMGHGIGLVVHEEPDLVKGGQIVLEPGMVLAVEAPFYITGEFGMNVENNVIVTEKGYELLDTSLPTQLMVL
ncbi:MAG TPA: aminopeptidase P family protein [Clostridia bacterium]|nr:aminopeptidase P family protein [Clostridia bacterium]